MKTFFNKIVTTFVLLVMVFNQSAPVAALQPSTDLPAAEAEAKPVALHELGKKPAQPRLYNQPAAPEITLELSAQPKFITAAGKVVIHWSIENLTANTSATLKISLPSGYIPTVTPSGSGTYDPISLTLSIPVTGSGTVSGDFTLNIQTPIKDAALPAVLMANEKTLASTELSLPVHEKFTAKKNGSTLSTENGRIKVKFAKNSLLEDAIVNVGAPAGDAMPKYSLSGNPFEIDAQGITSKKDLHQFPQDVAIDLDYSNMNLSRDDESNLTLYYYNPDDNNWYPLPSNVDPKTKTLHALTSHFTIFDAAINNWKDSHLPTVDAFQTSGFTGAATYSMPIEVPPGPGGFQPNLSLSYNSQVIDQSTARTQASWVGMGWSLGMNSIELNDNATNETNKASNWTLDDTWSINVNGISTTVVRHGQSWHAADENFLKIDYDDASDSWTVWDKSGNTYYFGEPLPNKPIQSVLNSQLHCGPVFTTYQWVLKRMVNPFGQEIKYTYTTENSGDIKVDDYNSSAGACQRTGTVSGIITGIYPESITYSGGNYRVFFGLEGRSDYNNAWSDGVFHLVQKKRLSNIFVQQSNENNGWNLIRRYDFEYANGTNPQTWATTQDGYTQAPLWKGITWNTSGKTSTLLRVHQVGSDKISELPTARFSYEDNMHLTRADNGYGGTVKFTYEGAYYRQNAPASKIKLADFGGNGGCDTSTFVNHYGSSAVECYTFGQQGEGGLKLRGTAISTELLNKPWLLRPGGYYKFYAIANSSDPATTKIRYGFFDGVEDILGIEDQTVVILPADASEVSPLLQATNSSRFTGDNYITMPDLYISLLTSVYRVTTREINDGNGHLNTFSYTYSTFSVNDDAHSASACDDNALKAVPPTCAERIEKYSEVRGHSAVTEQAPDGHVTTTTYYQDDQLRGRPNTITVKNKPSGGIPLSMQIINYSVDTLPMNALTNNGQGNGNIAHYWIKTDSEENRIYNSAGTAYDARQTSYVYTSYANYGNLSQKIEKDWNGTSWDSSPVYRTTWTAYYPINTTSLYLVGLPARQWVTDGLTNNAAHTQAQMLYVYGSNTNWDMQPTSAMLSAVRTLVSDDNYTQLSFGYDNWGNRTSVTAAKNYVTSAPIPMGMLAPQDTITQTTDFDAKYHTYPIKQKSPPISLDGGQTTTNFFTQFEYDYRLGLPIRQIDANGVKTFVTYDVFGRLTSVVKEEGTSNQSVTLEVRYNDLASPFNIELKQKVDATHNYLIRHSYDGIGREILTETGSGDFGFTASSKVAQSYFLNGGHNVTTQSVPFTGTAPTLFTTTIYDDLNRPLTVTPPDGKGITYSYNGLVTTVTDANNHTTTSTSNVWGQTISVTPPTGPNVQYGYDVVGNLTSALRGGLTTTIHYDKSGHKIDMSDPDMGYWTYHYSPLGNLDAQTDARGCTTTLLYDYLNRLTQKTYNTACNDLTRVNYTYDAGDYGKGRRTGMNTSINSAVVTSSSWIYDPRGRVTSEAKLIDGNTYITSSSYNNADMPVDMTYPDGEKITNSYNDKMLLEKVTSTLQPLGYVKGINYDTFGRVTDRTLGNDVISRYSYYDWTTQGGRLKTLKTSSNLGTSADLQNLTYTYDAVGNIQSISDAINTQVQNYAYDALDRLTHAEATSTIGDSGYSENYSYNINTGNLENKAGVTLYYDDVNHKHAVTSTNNNNGNPADDNTYSYDANGNQTQRTINGQPYQLSYDAEGHLKSIVNTNPQTIPATATASPVVTATATSTSTVTATATAAISATPSSTPIASLTPTATAVPNTVTFTSDAATDGWVLESTGSSGTGGSVDNASTTFNVGDDASNRQYRGILSFDTSSIPVGAVIQSATIRMKKAAQVGTNLLDTVNIRIDIANVRFGSAYTLQPMDFEAISGADMVGLITSGTQPDANGWLSAAINATGRGLISTTNKTQFRVRFGNTSNNATADYIKFASGDAANNNPQLVITYSMATPLPPATATPTATATATATATTIPTSAAGVTAPMTVGRADFTYDADGQMVISRISASTIPGNQVVTTIFVSAAYQVKTDAAVNAGQPVVTKYYPGGAMRVGTTLYYALTDHLGSTSVITSDVGVKLTETRYKAWGEVRYQSGTLPIDRTYTGQRTYIPDFGLMYYNARWYDNQVGRFAQADTIIPSPGNSQSWDRYAYVNNNPIRYVDPSGHFSEEELAQAMGFKDKDKMKESNLWKRIIEKGLRDMLLHAELGDILSFTTDKGDKFSFMFGQNEDGTIGLWEINRKQPTSLGVIISILADQKSPSWALFTPVDRTPETGDGYSFAYKYTETSYKQGETLDIPELSTYWTGGVDDKPEYVEIHTDLNTFRLIQDLAGVLGPGIAGIFGANVLSDVGGWSTGGGGWPAINSMQDVADGGHINTYIPIIHYNTCRCAW